MSDPSGAVTVGGGGGAVPPQGGGTVAASSPASKSQSMGSWVFGGILLLFYLWVFLKGPDVLPDYKLRMLGVLSALLAGLFVYFISGSVLLKVSQQLSSAASIGVRAGGGIAAVVGMMAWWSYSPPIASRTQVAAQLRQVLDSAAATSVQQAGSAAASGTATVQVPAQAQALARTLATSDTSFNRVARLASKGTVPLADYLRIRSALTQQAGLPARPAPIDTTARILSRPPITPRPAAGESIVSSARRLQRPR